MQRRILDYMNEVGLLENPRSRVKALVENMRGLWRYRVGDYRVIRSPAGNSHLQAGELS